MKLPISQLSLRKFKDAGRGHVGIASAERIIPAALAHFRAEITVLGESVLLHALKRGHYRIGLRDRAS